MNTQIVTINMIPGASSPPVVNVSQGDIGRPIAFRVIDGSFPAGSLGTATVVGTKPSGLGFTVNGTRSGSTITINTTLEMTQEAGMIPAEIRFANLLDNFDVGTANFILAVERDPHPENVTDGTYETMADIQTQVNALDTRVTALEAGGGGGSGLTDDVKTALLQIAQKVAYIDANGQQYYDDLWNAFNSGQKTITYNLEHITSSNTTTIIDSGESYTTTLTADSNYALNIVTVKMGGVDVTSATYSSGTVTIPEVTGNIVITAVAVAGVSSISAVYTPTDIVMNTDSLDSLKTDLVVTATYPDTTTETVPSADYTLSGTLTAGTSTITVSYGGKTTTFNATVYTLPSGYNRYDWTMNDVVNSSQATVDSGLSTTYSGTGYEHIIKFAHNTSNSTAGGIYGSRDQSGTSAAVNNRTIWSKSYQQAYVFNENTSQYGNTLTQNQPTTYRTTYDNGTAYVYIDGTQVYSGTAATFSPSYTGNIGLFGIIQGGTIQSSGCAMEKIRIYSFKVKDLSNGNYIAAFIPCMNSSNVAGMYDVIREQFVTSNVSGKLVAGND